MQALTSSTRRRAAHAICLMQAASLAGCADNAYYLKADAAITIPTELGALDPSLLVEHPLEVAATFKSDGVVQPQSSTTLYDSIASGLRSRGIYRMRRYAAPAGDVAFEIARLTPAPAEAAAKEEAPAVDPPPKAAAAPVYAPELLVLVENHPDLSRGTRARYFFSGLSMGSWSPNQPTDRYDVTIAYRDPQGRARIYHSHQELILSTGTTMFNRDDAGTAGLHRYDDPMAAFGGVVANSINGPGLVTVGEPSGAPAASGAAAATP